MRAALLTGLLLGVSAFAQEAVDGGPQSDLANEIDAAAGLTAPPTAPTPQQNPLVRAFQSLNPDLSVIVDATGGIGGKAPYSLAGDDPDLGGSLSDHPAGFTIQEAEFAFSAVVDPFFRADVFLTIPNLKGVEVEEAVVTSTSLPADLQVRAGIFRSAFGRQNGQHLHVQDFTRRPLINEAYLGGDGLRAPGLQVSWLAPTPFFLQLIGEAFSVGLPDSAEHLATFGGGKRTDLTYTAELKAFFPATESLSIYTGLNAAFGKTAGYYGASVLDAFGPPPYADKNTTLQGVDLYLKYKPANVTGGYFNLAWTTEFFVREVQAATPTVPLSSLTPEVDAGLYTQLVAQLSRSWYLGVRQDLLGLFRSRIQPRVARTSLSLTFVASEFARIRAYAERETRATEGAFFSGPPNWAGYLQLEVAIGAHGAHPF